jgi:hypothetical protein
MSSLHRDILRGTKLPRALYSATLEPFAESLAWFISGKPLCQIARNCASSSALASLPQELYMSAMTLQELCEKWEKDERECRSEANSLRANEVFSIVPTIPNNSWFALIAKADQIRDCRQALERVCAIVAPNDYFRTCPVCKRDMRKPGYHVRDPNIPMSVLIARASGGPSDCDRCGYFPTPIHAQAP